MQQSFANDIAGRRVLRDLSAPFLSRESLLLLATLACLAGVIGPFGTYDQFPTGLRLLYWAAIVVGTAGIGHAAASGLERSLRRRGVPFWFELTAIALVASVPVCLVVALVSLAFGFNPFSAHLPVLYLQCVAVLGCTALLFQLATPYASPVVPVRSVHCTALPPLLSRLPVAKRGRLLRLSAQDHFVEVVTENGTSLIALRFRDAIAEASPEPGLQCHRSHWVALHAVSGRSRQNKRSGLAMTCGAFVPIGRTFSNSVTQALKNAQSDI